jgi:hypothetical protein
VRGRLLARLWGYCTQQVYLICYEGRKRRPVIYGRVKSTCVCYCYCINVLDHYRNCTAVRPPRNNDNCWIVTGRRRRRVASRFSFFLPFSFFFLLFIFGTQPRMRTSLVGSVPHSSLEWAEGLAFGVTTQVRGHPADR